MEPNEPDISKAELLAIIQNQQETIDKLRAENEGFRKLIEGLQRQQHRPHAPHSKGPPQTNPKKPGRKPGTSYGRHGNRKPPAKVDEEYQATLPESTCCCDAPIIQDEVIEQFQEEFVRKVIRRKFHIHVGHCSCCGRRVQGRHPFQTSDAVGAAATGLGANAQALAVILNKEAGLSHGKITRLFQSFFDTSLTRGGSAQIMLRAAQRCEGYYKQIQVMVRNSSSVVMDETGWKVGGLLQWLHVAVTSNEALYRIEAGRGYTQSALLIGEEYGGFLIHDGWKPYDKFAKATHGTCTAHLLNRCNHMLDVARGRARGFPTRIKILLQKGLALRKRSDAGEISPHGLAVATGRLQRGFDDRVYRYFVDAANLRFAQHLWNNREAVFAYLRHPEIEPTSNRAERAIRPAVVNRKVWGGSRTRKGAAAQSILMSVLQTCHHRGKDGLHFLRRVFHSPKNRPPRLPYLLQHE